MNSLSLFLYAANIIGNLNVVMFLLGLICAIYVIVHGCRYIGEVDKKHIDDDRLTRIGASLQKSISWLVFVLLIIAFLPGERTVYMIAASELGQMTWESQEAQDIYQDLKKILDNYVKGTINDGKN